MKFALAMALSLAVTPAVAQQHPPIAPNDIWPTVAALRTRLVQIYAADREKCLSPPDQTQDYCQVAQDELDAIRGLDREIVEAQRK